MQPNIHLEPEAAMVIGALVADAASLGLHWIYDPERISQIEKETGVVFLPPDANRYAGVKGYFAHSSKTAGESSGYGESCLFALKHFARHGKFERCAYQQEFCTFFGPGGGYVGYIDSPTRKTLSVLLALDSQSYPEESGADDDQMLALSTIPAIVAVHRGSINDLFSLTEKVVRITNNNRSAVAAALCLASVLFKLRDGMPLRKAMMDAATQAESSLSERLLNSLAMNDKDSFTAAKEFGSACHVREGLPVVFHIANKALDYRTAIEENIRVGGDSCGRAIALGAIMATSSSKRDKGATGIPLLWLAQVRGLQAATNALVSIAE